MADPRMKAKASTIAQAAGRAEGHGEVLAPLATVAAHRGLASLADRLAELRGWLCEDLGQLERALAEVEAQSLRLPGARVAGAAAHLLGRHGKRIRPLCVLLGARLGGQPIDQSAHALAVACELVHAATLLHDDVIDEGQVRRGVPAARMVYGNSASVLAGDYLLTYALRRVLDTGHTGALERLLTVISGMVAAEALQLERRGRLVLDRALYMDVVRGKTAALFAWALSSGGLLANLGAHHAATLREVGVHLGIAFQLVDDVLDLQGDAATTGKQNFADLRQGKLTWPLILACENDPQLHAALSALASQAADAHAPSEAEVGAWLARLHDSGAADQTRSLAGQEAAEACAKAATLPASRARDALIAVIESAVCRLG